MHVVEEVAVGLHEGEVVLVAEQVCPASLAVAQREHRHGERDGLPAYAQLDLAPVELALLAGLVPLLDEHFLGLLRPLGLAPLYVLAHARVADVEAFLQQDAVYVLALEALLPHPRLAALGVLRQPILYLRAYRLCELLALRLTCRVLRLAGQAHVCPSIGIRLHHGLIFPDVACHSLTVETCPAGYLPQTQTIIAMVV